MSLLYVQSTLDKGSGVYTGQKFRRGAEVLRFEGPVLSASDVPYPLRPEDDHYLQIGVKIFLGPSGGIDDLVNHSCEPNCMVAIGEGRATLVAVKNIQPDTEVTFDYSTTSTDDKSRWSLNCHCGSKRCRGVISGFHTVPMDIQKEYIERHMVPAYVLDHFLPFWLGLN
jgi:hypothetical protein